CAQSSASRVGRDASRSSLASRSSVGTERRRCSSEPGMEDMAPMLAHPRMSLESATVSQSALHFSLLFACFDALALVVLLFAAREAHQDLQHAALDVDLQRHDRHSIALDGAAKLFELPAVQ